ncbi:MAG: tetrathionate reductase family octaheme c-type cytochrome [Candidatus Marinimicrobia bacterium]|nr:tetrathionate reductase family octaheme c-type cytochrome [Candidatus Neomarinimicrobiota bacterium]
MKSHMILLTSSLLLFNLLTATEDHSEYFEGEGPFESVHEVTEMCLDCHDDAAFSFMQNVHWTWGSDPTTIPSKSGEHVLGKKTVLNNFCIGLKGNEARCTSCHAGYGWKDDSFDFSDPMNIDCLVCHDHTGTYKKFPTAAGYPAMERKEFPPKSGKYFEAVELEAVASSVGGTPTRMACGSCHFYGGGGNNVKHGDLEKALVNPSEELDVHMGGEDFTCVDCHESTDHSISGNALSVSSHRGTLSCTNCHDEDPHDKYAVFYDQHAKTIACQTCHIPEFARENPTKMEWDWSQAGESRPHEEDQYGMPTYHKKKGAFVWGKNVVPQYAWYNGASEHMVVGDKINLDSSNKITAPVGSIEDNSALIYPFKIHRGKQIADKKNLYLLPTHLFGGGYWKHFDWDKSVSVGAANYGLDYSGKYTFVETEMWWKINHMVAPKEKALGCKDCHSKIEETRFDWKALGYKEGDPRYNRGTSRFPRVK